MFWFRDFVGGFSEVVGFWAVFGGSRGFRTLEARACCVSFWGGWSGDSGCMVCFAKNSNFAVLRKHLRISRNTLLLLFSRSLGISRNGLYVWGLRIACFKMMHDVFGFWGFEIFSGFREWPGFRLFRGNCSWGHEAGVFSQCFLWFGLSNGFSFRRCIICWGGLGLSGVVGGGAAPRRRILLFCKSVYYVWLGSLWADLVRIKSGIYSACMLNHVLSLFLRLVLQFFSYTNLFLTE